jgi:hypothetical protein
VNQCYTNDNFNCYQDNGTLCNFTGNEAYCMANYTNNNLCDTKDGLKCFNYSSGWYSTLD